MGKSIQILIVLLVLSACSIRVQNPTTTSLPPTTTPQPTSCNSVEGPCVEITFDGDTCTFEGPSELIPGPLAFIFYNESQDWASSNLMKLTEGKTIEDLRAYFWEEPSENHQPPWSISIPGSWKEIQGGEAHFWEGIVEPGIYTLVCVHSTPWPKPIGVWVGPIWTIKE
jgi:hypothetical protein